MLRRERIHSPFTVGTMTLTFTAPSDLTEDEAQALLNDLSRQELEAVKVLSDRLPVGLMVSAALT